MIIDYKDTTFACDFSGSVRIHGVERISLRIKIPYSARRNRSASAVSPNIECRPAECRTMMHQTKPKSVGLRRLVRKSDSVIDDRQTKFGTIHREPNINLLGSAMF